LWLNGKYKQLERERERRGEKENNIRGEIQEKFRIKENARL